MVSAHFTKPKEICEWIFVSLAPKTIPFWQCVNHNRFGEINHSGLLHFTPLNTCVDHKRGSARTASARIVALCELVIPLCIVYISQVALIKQSVTSDYSLIIQLWREWQSTAFFVRRDQHSTNLTSSKPTNGGSADMCLFVSGPDAHGSLAKGIRDLRISCKALW